MRKYSKYKTNGVEWLGETPIDWSLEKVKFHLSFSKGTNPKELIDENMGELPEYISVENLRGKQKNIQYVKDWKTCKLIDDSDILLLWDGANAGEFMKGKKGVLSSTMAKLLFHKKITKEFGWYLFRRYEKEIREVTIGMGIPHVNGQDLKNSIVPIPSLSEQHVIVRFLDYKTGQIDSFIANRQKQIELLKEQKADIINKAVTKGINPNAKMKDSGIKWIGEVPEHWIVSKIKFAGKIINGYAFESKDFKDSGIRVVKISNIQTRIIDWSEESFVDPLLFDKLVDFRIKKDDLVFALTRPIISTGIKAAIIDTEEPLLINQRNAVFRPKSINKKFLYHIIFNEDFIQYFESLIDNTGQQPNISSEDIANIKIPLPPLEEQTEVVKYLDEHCGEIDTLISKYQKQIDLMQEYRNSLISQAVTGKIDVREWQPKKQQTA